MFWKKKKAATENSAVKERLRLTQIHIGQQVEENKQLRIALEEQTQAVLRTKIMLDETIGQVNMYETQIKEHKQQIKDLETSISTCEADSRKISGEITNLKQEQGPITTDIRMVGINGEESVQEVLDRSEINHEVIYFKDSKNQTWILKKRAEMSL